MYMKYTLTHQRGGIKYTKPTLLSGCRNKIEVLLLSEEPPLVARELSAILQRAKVGGLGIGIQR